MKSIYFLLLVISITAVFGANYWFSNLYSNDFMVMSSLGISIIIFIASGCRISSSKYKTPITLSLFMWLSGVLVALGYGLPVSVILKESSYTIAPIFIYLAFHPLIKNRNDVLELTHILSISGLICNIVAIIEMFFALRGIDILRMNVFERMRNGTPRFIIGETIITISFFLSCSILLDRQIPKSRKRLHIINIVLTSLNLFWIIKTRSLSLYMLATVLMVPVINKRTKRRIRIFFGVLVIAILIYILVSDFVPTANSIIGSDYGIQMRFAMISYYWQYFKDHWLFGAGYISANPYYSTYSIISGPNGRFYTSDVGVIGLMFRNGVIGLAWLITWFGSNLKIIKENSQKVPFYFDMWLKLMILFWLFSCINLILTDTPRFPYIALGMLIVESSYLLKKNDTY